MSQSLPQPNPEPEHRGFYSYVLFLLTALLLIAAFAAPTFRVKNIHVVGASLPVNAMIQASGAEDRNVFTIRGANIADNLRSLPEILVTGVDISLPNSVTIHAELRKPVLGWKHHGRLYLVDKYGRLIAQAKSTVLPIILDNTPPRVVVGKYVSPAVVVAALYARKELPGAAISGFDLGVKRGVTIQSSQGWTAVLGTPTGTLLATRVATLQEVIHKVREQSQNSQSPYYGRRLSRVDLRGRSPYVATI